MYNFLERVKVPLSDYIKHNSHKNYDGDIQEQIINGFSNEYDSNSIDLPSVLKESTFSLQNGFRNPLSLSSTLMPPSNILNESSSSILFINNINTNNNNNNNNNTELISPSNITSIPSEISDCNSSIITATTTAIAVASDIQHILPNSELRSNKQNKNNNNEINEFRSLLDQSTKLQTQMQTVMKRMQEMHNNFENIDIANTHYPTTADAIITTPISSSSNQYFQHHHNYDEDHLIPNSKRTITSESIFDFEFKSQLNKSIGFKRNSSTTRAFYLNSSSSSNQTIIDIDYSENDSETIEQQHEKVKTSNNHIIKSESIIDILINDDNVSNQQQQVVLEPIIEEKLDVIEQQQQIPKIKSRFNKEKMERFKKIVIQVLKPETTEVPIHIVDKDQTENKVVPFLMELGRALIMSGVPAHRLEYELTLISSTFGLDGHFFTTPTGIFFSFGSPHTILSPYTHFLRINSTDYNMNRMVKLERLADKVIYGEISCIDALEKLKLILEEPPIYGIYLTVFSFVMSSFAVSFFFNASWIEVGATSIVGLYVGLLCLLSSKVSMVGRILESMSAFGGAFIASLFNAFIYPIPIFMVTLGGIIVLAPGLGLTIAVSEISTRNLVSGTSRLVNVFICLLQLTFGIVLGTTLSGLILPLRDEIIPDAFPYWSLFLVVPIAATSFGIQFKVSPKHIWVIIIASALGVVTGNWGVKYFGDIGSFFGSFAVCMLGNLYSRLTNISATVPIMSALILLVPGSMGVKGLVSVSSGDISSGIDFIQGMFLIGMSLTLGLLLSNLLIKPLKSM